MCERCLFGYLVITTQACFGGESQPFALLARMCVFALLLMRRPDCGSLRRCCFPSLKCEILCCSLERIPSVRMRDVGVGGGFHVNLSMDPRTWEYEEGTTKIVEKRILVSSEV